MPRLLLKNLDFPKGIWVGDYYRYVYIYVDLVARIIELVIVTCTLWLLHIFT